MVIIPSLFLALSFAVTATCALSAPSGGGATAFTNYDRFRASCPADLSCIRQFEPSLVPAGKEEVNDEEAWVAVFRSSNNLPSVFVKDDFMNAMRIATTFTADTQDGGDEANTLITVSSAERKLEKTTSVTPSSVGGAIQASKPVAVAHLSKSPDHPGQWVIDSMRCALKKEDTDSACDGGSEHSEAVSICIDELLLHHLRSGRRFEEAIRARGTLVSGVLLEDRGFKEVTELSKDMATHISSIEGGMAKYADRAVSKAAKNPGARDRALEILSYLGRLDQDKEREVAEELKKGGDDDEEEYDPWAAVKSFI